MIQAIKKQIPNSLTLVNLLSGCLAIISLFSNHVSFIPYFVLISLIADFLDGMLARLLNVSSPIGKELDSLADMISFGVLPGMLLVSLTANSFFLESWNQSLVDQLAQVNSFKTSLLIFFPLIATLFSALRLAKFNISTNQSKEFMGLATPAATIFVLGLFMNAQNPNYTFNFLYNSISLNIIALILSFLLICNIPMFSFKLGAFSWKENKYQICLLILAILLLAFFKFAAIPLIIIVYILLNLLRLIIK